MPGRLLFGTVATTLLVTVGCVSASMSASSSSPARMVTAETKLHQRSEGLQAAETALDGDRALAYWADDAVVQPAGSPAVVGKAAILNLYHEFFTTMGVKELVGTPSHLAMSQSGDLAYETGVNRIVIHTPGGDLLDMGKYLIVWKRVDGQWYVGALSFTSDAASPTPIAGK
jgi:ketosteroid isomerase-like protein